MNDCETWVRLQHISKWLPILSWQDCKRNVKLFLPEPEFLKFLLKQSDLNLSRSDQALFSFFLSLFNLNCQCLTPKYDQYASINLV